MPVRRIVKTTAGLIDVGDRRQQESCIRHGSESQVQQVSQPSSERCSRSDAMVRIVHAPEKVVGAGLKQDDIWLCVRHYGSGPVS